VTVSARALVAMETVACGCDVDTAVVEALIGCLAGGAKSLAAEVRVGRFVARLSAAAGAGTAVKTTGVHTGGGCR
jgi:hypothetical protein